MEYDELILANDSVFGPLYPIKDLFDKLEKDSQWDICGIDRVQSYEQKLWYMSSFFMVFKKHIFCSDLFKDIFSQDIGSLDLNTAIEKFEKPFMKKFYTNGYKVKCLIEADKQIYFHWKEHILLGNPFVKRKVFFKPLYLGCNSYRWYEFISNNTQYPVKLIQDYLVDNEDYSEDINELKNINKRPLKTILLKKLKEWRKWLIQINIKKNRKTVRIFGWYLINIDRRVIPISKISEG